MLRWLADYGRLLKAGATLARHDAILPGEYKSRLPLPARIAGGVLRIFGGGAKGRPGERLATALEKLGPAYIKLGQFLATRPDVFGVEATSDLSRLKDKLPAFSETTARDALTVEFPGEADRMFGSLGPAIAAASLAQVHKVETADGARAVKILRPKIEGHIHNEVRAMKRAASTIESIDPASKRLEPAAFVETLGASMEKELDLRLEAGAGSEFAEIAAIDGYFHVPEVDWARSSKRVLTTEWVSGVPFTAPDILEHIPDRTDMANRVTRGFLAAAIEHGVFHADMHEGNMILDDAGRLVLVDFGIMGRIGFQERRFLAEILYGFLKRDYTRVAEVHFEAGYVPKNRSVGDFAQALRSVGEPIHGKGAEDVSMGRLLLQLFDFTHTFGMHLRPELVLLQKTMVQVEGVARNIDPKHNIWEAAEPIVERWTKAEFGPEGIARHVKSNSRDLVMRLSRLPEFMDKLEAAIDHSLVEPQKPETGSASPWRNLIGFALVVALGTATLWGVLELYPWQ